MKTFDTLLLFSFLTFFTTHQALAQCASPGKDGNNYNLNNYPNTFYSPTLASYALTAGVTNEIQLKPATYTSSVAPTDIGPGDLVLIIQIQGAEINTSNSSNYGGGDGTGSGYLNNAGLLAGNYEYAVAASGTNVTAVAGGTLKLVSPIQRQYRYANANNVTGRYRYQCIKVPQYFNLKITDKIIAPQWNGEAGGLIVLDVYNELNLNADTLSATGRGFRGGGGVCYTGTVDAAARGSWRYTARNRNLGNINPGAHGAKGEGIAGTPRFVYIGGVGFNSVIDTGEEGYPNGSTGMGAPGNAGGGGTDASPQVQVEDGDESHAYGNQFNPGGGGGGGWGKGGWGGWHWNLKPGHPDSTNADGTRYLAGGMPGARVRHNGVEKIIFGAGGGAGSSNDDPWQGGWESSGAPGGGAIVILASKIIGVGVIEVNGTDAPDIWEKQVNNHSDATGGASGGGIVLIQTAQAFPGTVFISAAGGTGGSNHYGMHGPGGGGGGGLITVNHTLAPGTYNVSGGQSGTTGGIKADGTASGPGQGDRVDSSIIKFGSTPGEPGAFIEAEATVITKPYECIPLADEKIYVSAKAKGRQTLIEWKLVGQNLAHHFVVQHNTGSNSWQDIFRIQALPNVSTYTFMHQQSPPGTNQYRIKAEHINGNAAYSAVVTAVTTENGPLQVLAKEGHLFFTGLETKKYTVQLITAIGTMVIRAPINAAGTASLQLPAHATGVYFVQLLDEQGNNIHVQKLHLSN